MRNEIWVEDNTIYEYDIECLRQKEEKLKIEQKKEANMLALLLCLHGTKSRKDV
jgi:hypothetical protein